MSWLNNSLSNIKGQITNFAHEVLSEGTEDDQAPNNELDEANKRLLELENIVSNQNIEIASLRKQNNELSRKESDRHRASAAGSSGSQNVRNMEDSWFWTEDDVETDETSSQEEKRQKRSDSAELKSRIMELEQENLTLSSSLEELDSQHNIASQKLLEIKNELQKKYDGLMEELRVAKTNKQHDEIQHENDRLKIDFDKVQEDLAVLQDENFELQKTIQDMKSSKEEKPMLNELLNLKKIHEELLQENSRLKIDIDKTEEDRSILQDQNFELQQEIASLKNTLCSNSDLETLKTENLNLKTENENMSKLKAEIEALKKMEDDLKFENNRLKIDYDKVQNDMSVLQDSNFELQEEIEMLKNSSCPSDLSSTIEILQKENIELKNEMKGYSNSDIDALKKKNEDLIHENNRLKLDLNKTEEDRSVLQDANFELQAEVETLKNNVSMSDANLESVKTECSQLKCELETLRKMEDGLKFENDRLKVDIDKCEEDRCILQDANFELQEIVTTLKNNASTSDTDLDLLRQENLNLKNDIKKYSELKMELETLKKKEEVLKFENERLKIDYEKVEEDRSILQDKNFELQEEIQTVKNKSSFSDSDLDALKKENSNLKLDINKLKTELEVLKKQNEELKFQNDRLKIDYEKVEEDFSVLQDSNFELHNEIESVKNAAQSCKNELETLKNENINLKVEIENNSKLKSELETLKKKKDDLKFENERLKIDYEKTQEDMSILQDSNFELQEEIDILKHGDCSSAKKEEEIVTLKSKIKEYLNEIHNLKQKIACFNDGSGDSSRSIQTEDIKQYNRMKIDYEKVQDDFSVLQTENFELQQKLNNFNRSEFESLENQVTTLKEEKQCMKSELDKIQNIHTDEIIRELQDKNNKLQAEKQTISLELAHYEKECNDLMKNYDKLYLELEAMKSSKLETISENNEESFLNLEQQLEDCSSLNQSLEDRYKDLEHRLEQSKNEKLSLTQELNAANEKLEDMKNNLDILNANLETFEQEKLNLALQLNEFRSKLPGSENTIEYSQIKEAVQCMKNEREVLNQENILLKQELQRTVQNLEQRNPKVQILDSMSGRVQKLDHSNSDRLKIELQTALDAVESLKSQNNDLSNKTASELQNYKAVEITLRHQIDELKQQLNAAISDRSHLENAFQQLDVPNADQLKSEFIDMKTKYDNVMRENENMSKLLQQNPEERKQLENAYGVLLNEKNELIKLITAKHEENVKYHAEIQRLTGLLQAELAKSIEADSVSLEKLTDQVGFLREKCDILTNSLVTEQSNVKLLNQEKRDAEDKAASSSRELERLRQHLVEVEQSHTQEIMELDMKNNELQTKINNIEEHAIYNNTAYTSASIRANQQAETLQTQLTLMSQQRDELLTKMNDAEDKYNRQIAALTNLQCALEQFQRDKEQDIQQSTSRLRAELDREHNEQIALRNELTSARTQLAEQQQGLMAAGRLAGQLETSQAIVQALKQDLKQSQDKYAALHAKMESAQSNQADKIEKGLVKNLMLGYITTAQQTDKAQILKIISAVLDFNQSECDRIGLNSSQKSSWFGGSLLRLGEEGLAKAFVEFLEKESLPRAKDSSGLSLLQITHDTPVPKSEAGQASSSTSTSSTSANALLSQVTSTHSENLLPTFAPPRSASSILKDVLKDNNT